MDESIGSEYFFNVVFEVILFLGGSLKVEYRHCDRRVLKLISKAIEVLENQPQVKLVWHLNDDDGVRTFYLFGNREAFLNVDGLFVVESHDRIDPGVDDE